MTSKFRMSWNSQTKQVNLHYDKRFAWSKSIWIFTFFTNTSEIKCASCPLPSTCSHSATFVTGVRLTVCPVMKPVDIIGCITGLPFPTSLPIAAVVARTAQPYPRIRLPAGASVKEQNTCTIHYEHTMLLQGLKQNALVVPVGYKHTNTCHGS